MPLSEHVYCVVITFKMTEWVQQWICIKFCIKLEYSSVETVQMIQKAAARGNWWLAASSQQCTHSCTMSRAEFFGETSNHPGDSAAPTAQMWCPVTSGFSWTKIIFEREEITDHQWDSGKYNAAANGVGRTVWGPKVSTLKGTEISLSYVQCFLYLLQ